MELLTLLLHFSLIKVITLHIFFRNYSVLLNRKKIELLQTIVTCLAFELKEKLIFIRFQKVFVTNLSKKNSVVPYTTTTIKFSQKIETFLRFGLIKVLIL